MMYKKVIDWIMDRFYKKASLNNSAFINNNPFQSHSLLFEKVSNEFALSLEGIHGVKHWIQVYHYTQFLAKSYNIESEVFLLFSLLHDSKRENEYEDIEHGIKAARSIEAYQNQGLILLSNEDTERLIFACANHTKADKSHPLYQDLVVQICLDADKLDIGRVGVIPHESHFLTDVAKKIVKNSTSKL